MVCGLWNLGRIHFNPLPPHGGRRCSRTCGTAAACISIHSLRMEGDKIADVIAGLADISIHSLRMEGDRRQKQQRADAGRFQSTPSAWRETLLAKAKGMFNTISIHSLRMEGDHGKPPEVSLRKYFNPLPPHGGRPRRHIKYILRFQNFNPLPPHGGRPHRQRRRRQRESISIHSLRMEGDERTPHELVRHKIFQSTPSAWRETGSRCFFILNPSYFNPLPPHGGRLFHAAAVVGTLYFNPLPPHGGRQGASARNYRNPGFQSTPSAWRETQPLPGLLSGEN